MLDPLHNFPSVFDRLEKVSALQNGYIRRFRCPAHDDSHPSGWAFVHRESEMLVLKCHRGCRMQAIMMAVGLKRKDIHMSTKTDLKWILHSTFYYCHADGSMAFRVKRFHGMDGDERVVKKFIQQKPSRDGRGWDDGVDGIIKPLYRLPELMEAATDKIDRAVYFVEGEIKCDLLRSIGFVSTTFAGGSNAVFEPYNAVYLGGRRIVLCLDNDATGQRWAEAVTFKLLTAREPPKLLAIMMFPELAEKGDVGDWIEERQERGIADEDIRDELLERAVRLPKVMIR